jgi:hypothetical protein
LPENSNQTVNEPPLVSRRAINKVMLSVSQCDVLFAFKWVIKNWHRREGHAQSGSIQGILKGGVSLYH